MKPFFFVLFALFALLAVISTAVAEETVVPTAIVEETPYAEIVVSGFGIDQFAVRGLILEQINEVVVPRIKKARPDSTWTVYIVVIGSADSVGTSAENDRLSKDRAEAVAAELELNFGVKPIVTPHGDEANKRQIIVKYKFVKYFKAESFTAFLKDGKIYPDSLSANKKETSAIKAIMALPLWAISIIVIIGLGILACFFLVIFYQFISARKVELIWLDITTRDSGIYSVEVGYTWRTVGGKKEEIFVSPFTNLGKRKKKIKKFSKLDIVSSLRGCLEGDKFASQIPSLEQSGKIVKKS